MNPPDTLVTKKTPLEAIQQAEAEVARQIVIAHQATEQMEAEARSRVTKIQEEAIEASRLMSENEQRKCIAQTRLEAQKMTTLAQAQAKELHQYGTKNLRAAVKYAVSFVIGLPEEEEKS